MQDMKNFSAMECKKKEVIDMQCAIFALIGVIIGAATALVSKEGIKKPIWREKKKESDYIGGGEVKSDKQLMQQWQNLLSYGTDEK